MILLDKCINLGIGFVTGRANVCKIINSYYSDMLEQLSTIEKKVKLTLFVLYDLNYQSAEREQFYDVIPDVYRGIEIRYITPEIIKEEKKKILVRKNVSLHALDLLLGYGHAKGRNTVMYFAYKYGMDCLLFWDDDEYPVANIKNGDKIFWKKQNNIIEHLKYITDCDVTIGYHCGYISPIPYVEVGNEISEKAFKNYIEAVSNDIVSWNSIKLKMQKDFGVTYADEKISSGIGAYEISKSGAGKWVAGSTLCLNLRNIKKIPAFYNPAHARGEDTFFSIKLNDSKVMKVPVYHFHDGFLNYRKIMKGKYPSYLHKTDNNKKYIGKRFFDVSVGWIRYKPLLMYITDKNNFEKNIDKVYENLNDSIDEVNRLFKDFDFSILLDELKKYSRDVERHYKEYEIVNEVWKYLIS